MKHNFLVVVLVGIVSSYSIGQQLPRYAQYMFDPYLINPSLVAPEDKPEVNLLYNRQWTGIQDGPKTLQADLQYPFNKRLAAGINISEDRTVLLSKTAVMATFAYKVPLTSDQVIGFGLSGGFLAHRLRLEDVPAEDMNDPALYSYENNSLRFNSQFGAYYRFKSLTVGFSLLQLVNDRSSSPEMRQASSGRFHDIAAHASWQFALSDVVSVQPNFAYRFNSNNMNYYDAALLVVLNDAVEVGAGHHQYLGSNLIARVNLENIRIGYAFGFSGSGARSALGNSSEIQLKWLFGEKVRKKEKEKSKSDPDIYKEYSRRKKRIEHQKRKYRKMVE